MVLVSVSRGTLIAMLLPAGVGAGVGVGGEVPERAVQWRHSCVDTSISPPN